MPTTAPALPASFTRRKALILSQLSVPAAQYADRSPKGSIDEGVRDLIEGINAREGWVTTSSCAGRVSVFVEGAKRRKGGAREVGSGGQGGERGAGGEAFEREDGKCRGEDEGDGDGDGEIGKGNVRREVKLAEAGGRWLFVSHEGVDAATLQGEGVLSLLGLRRMGDVIGAGKQFTEERLVHFKFEPMVSVLSLYL
jgi:tRNA wybutosine-synthesizing protein 3